MADEPPLSYLLDCAGKVFSRAGSLGFDFHSARKSGLVSYDPSNWDLYASDFDEFCDMLLELREAIQNPPDDFAPVAECLREAGRIARNIRDTHRRTMGRGFADFLDFFPDLNTVSQDGWRAIQEVTKPWQRKDPFAFVDEPKPSAARIDTTPNFPKPPADLIDSAACSVPGIMANVVPKNGGSIELVASHLAKRLLEAGHTLAAAHWAVHELVGSKKLTAAEIEVELPSTFGGIGGGAQWSGGGKGTIGIAEGKPAPFDTFKVVATPSLWTWWRLLTNDRPTQTTPDGGTVTKAKTADATDTLPMEATDAELPQTEATDTPRPAKKRKRSTERGEGRAKLIAALTKHHKYEDGSCLNVEYIGNNELARLAEVSESTASAFFKDKFQGHANYRAICGDTTGLIAAIKLLNNEFSPHLLFGGNPPGENERDD